ncbi:hypothetical protein QBC33DRAFT_540869 [Phialemonium atrogriseum]|uniref:Uncharacterized protein n=1 Tax=Phialemonium atrogriseum TaxID=1093897 RepID=A0AAJ0FGA3_9PEZI|nr:uncharacterized protein QBC33DRAFT_540869 [Phialemonium atrogriseum]KAK1766392.1 hypothetical protein QBC33DRAFT_540869 [Phialemonium atrogriseum]
MAWGRSKPEQPPSTLRQLLPLIITLIFVGIAAWIGYQIYVSVNKIRAKASERMSNNNVVFTKDGMRVKVKQIKNESYVDATQSWVVKAWNLGSEKAPNKKQ